MAVAQRAGCWLNVRRTGQYPWGSSRVPSLVSFCSRARHPGVSVIACCSSSTQTECAPAHSVNSASTGSTPKHLISSEQIELTFAELGLKSIQDKVGGCRFRQHVNPLKAALIAPVKPPNWDEIFSDCLRPLTVDIGCGSGRFLMVLAKRNSTENFLGIDVRAKLVDRARLWAEELQLSNAHFVTTNATLHLNSLLCTYPGPLTYVTILCPDPHFKQKHHKRRVVQKQLVDSVLERLAPGGKLFLQSDVKEIALDMRKRFDEHLGVRLSNCSSFPRDSEGWVVENPLGLPSEREVHVLTQGGRIYRSLYEKI